MSGSVYGQASASSADVVFPFELMTPAAHDLYELADRIGEIKGQLDGQLDHVRTDWTGPERKTFDGKVSALATNAQSVQTALVHLANELARAWAAARGQQDRINAARENEALQADDGWGENAWEWFAGENEKVDIPDDPPVPIPSGYAKTRAPMYAHRGP